MNGRDLWPVVVLAVGALAGLTVILALHIDPTPYLTALGLVAVPVLGSAVYAKVSKVEANTNGTTGALVAMLSGAVEHLKMLAQPAAAVAPPATPPTSIPSTPSPVVAPDTPNSVGGETSPPVG